MATKKGEGVRGVLGGLVTKAKEPQEQSAQPADIAEPVQPGNDAAPEAVSQPPAVAETAEPETAVTPQPKKVIAIKGRPRAGKVEPTDSKTERTKITLSMDVPLRDQFYRLALLEGLQPHEYVDRALRHWIKQHPK